ncbi:MAG: sigma-54 dependent transcriptional regulator, partial [Pseudomonadota bacterium]
MKSTILVVDDDPVQRRLLQASVERLGYEALCCADGDAALVALSAEKSSSIAAIILDLMMPGLDGLGVLKHMEEHSLNVPTIVQTAQGSLDAAIGAMRAGAFDFVVKPVSPERLKSSLSDALKVAELKQKPEKKSVEAVFSSPARPQMIASTDTMNRVSTMIDRAAQSDIPVLIEGESGTGKELVAQTIQSRGDRAKKPMVVVNCGAIPDNLVESILFGHEKGAFTGATEKHVGKFVEADGGTLFLDEIGELPLGAQVKLLRAIQQGEIEPVGASKSKKVDIRLISATNRDLIAAVRDGRFREDLYYRLNVFPILVPPLRNRRGDIAALANHFMDRHRGSGTNFSATKFSADALDLLIAYDWPGNIRQLENAIFRAMVLSDNEQLDAQDFAHIAAQLDKNQIRSPESEAREFGELKLAPEYPLNEVQVGFADSNDEQPSASSNNFLNGPGHIHSLADIEMLAIKAAIAHYDGQMSEVARRLGIGRSTLYRKLKDYEIEPDAV